MKFFLGLGVEGEREDNGSSRYICESNPLKKNLFLLIRGPQEYNLGESFSLSSGHDMHR